MEVKEINQAIENLGGDTGSICDGYHTFDELYEYRKLYNAAFFNMLSMFNVCKVHKSKRHFSGEECFGGGWFIVIADLPTGQVSNHYEMKDWELFQCPEQEKADVWDGHTPNDAARRIEAFCRMPQNRIFQSRPEVYDPHNIISTNGELQEELETFPKEMKVMVNRNGSILTNLAIPRQIFSGNLQENIIELSSNIPLP